jgi:putative phage-type endonuclease
LTAWHTLMSNINDRCPVHDGIEQGSDEWHALRAGSITGSKIGAMLAGGSGATREKYLHQLAVERIIGRSAKRGFKSKSMQYGNEMESVARDHYEFVNACTIEQVAYIRHPSIDHAGMSPDGLIDDDGLIEIKCPDPETHVDYLLTRDIPANYMYQMQWQMACSGRSWCDWMSYCDELPNNIRALIIRVPRDDKMISYIEMQARLLNHEIEQLIETLEKIK